MSSRLVKILTTAFITVAVIFTGCSRVTINLGQMNKEKVTEEEALTVDKDGVKELYVENVVGDIHVIKAEGDSIKVKVGKRVEGPTKEKAEEVMNNIFISTEVNGGKLEIKAVTKEEKKDFWKWKNENHTTMNVNLDFYVEVPMNLESCMIKDVTGNIEVENLASMFKVDSVTGNISLNDTTILGRSNVNLVTGNINLKTEMDKTSDIKVSNITGNLNITLPKDANFNIKGSVVTGNIGGSFDGLKANKSITGGGSVDQSFNGGNSSLHFELVTGNVKLNKE